MGKGRKKGYWTKERIEETISGKGYSSISQWREDNNRDAEIAARRLGVYKEVTRVFRVRGKRGHWQDFKTVFRESLRYQTKADFRRGSRGAHKACLEKNPHWWPLCTAHMSRSNRGPKTKR